jgi:hypothetical protein
MKPILIINALNLTNITISYNENVRISVNKHEYNIKIKHPMHIK